MKLIDEIGNQYGRLTVIRRVENRKDGTARWLCKCECGTGVIAEGINLRIGAVKSCGCLQLEARKTVQL